MTIMFIYVTPSWSGLLNCVRRVMWLVKSKIIDREIIWWNPTIEDEHLGRWVPGRLVTLDLVLIYRLFTELYGLLYITDYLWSTPVFYAGHMTEMGSLPPSSSLLSLYSPIMSGPGFLSTSPESRISSIRAVITACWRVAATKHSTDRRTTTWEEEKERARLHDFLAL